MRRFSTKNAAGFSLLELMVVVAIIGVLATFAVPRFNVIRARARQGEAKSNLGVIFTLQEAFKIDKEKYYDGDKTAWGGADGMNTKTASKDGVGYHGNGAAVGSTAACTTPGVPAGCGASGTDHYCGANKLGFRLANCAAARYVYWIDRADENEFLAVAFARSDEAERIFPGCTGNRPAGAADSSTKPTADTTAEACSGTKATDMPAVGGDAHCLDQNRTVYNFRDIVEDPLCVN